MPAFSYEIQQSSDSQHVLLRGDITESAAFDPLAQKLSSRVVLDLADVRRINSCGVREWIRFIEKLRAAGSDLKLTRCSLAVVSQLNMISNFAGGAKVESVFAPYFCDSCNDERQRLLDVTALRSGALNEAWNCPECGTPARFDDLPDSFVAFTKG